MLQFPIAMTPRTEPARALAWLSPVIAFALTVFTGFCLFAALGQDPVKALGVFFIAPLDSLRGWTEIAVKMTPLLLCAAGLVVCFKANVWNIGAEGQLIAGAITGGVVALACDPSWGRWYVVLVMLASAAGGAVWGGFTALLRHRFHANEILVSLMLVYVAQFLLAWCVQGPMRDPMGFGFPQTKLFEAGAMLPVLDVHSSYGAPAYDDDLLTVRVTLAELPKVRMRFDFEIYRENGERINTGSVTLAFMNSATRRACRAPQRFLKLLEPYF